jgi:hypothetical protein
MCKEGNIGISRYIMRTNKIYLHKFTKILYQQILYIENYNNNNNNNSTIAHLILHMNIHTSLY